MKFHLNLDADQNGNPNVWGGAVIVNLEVQGWSFVGGPEPQQVAHDNAQALFDAIKDFFDTHLPMPGGWYTQSMRAEVEEVLVQIPPAAPAAAEEPAPQE